MRTYQVESSQPEIILHTSPVVHDAAVTTPEQIEKQREALVVQHMPLVRFVARQVRQHVPQHVELDDMISAGFLGLVDAALKFDPSKQVQFKSYAHFRIRGAIIDSLRTLDWSPRELRRKGRQMAEAIRELSTKLGRTPTGDEVADQMGLQLCELQELTGELKALEVGSLNEERTEDADHEEIDFLMAPETDSPLTLCIETEQRRQLEEALQALPEKEQIVLRLYYFQQMTMKEIGATLGVVESRVSQIRSSGIRRMKRTFARKGVRAASLGIAA